jgi:Fe-S cluster assembly iron-binding protein IscA
MLLFYSKFYYISPMFTLTPGAGKLIGELVRQNTAEGTELTICSSGTGCGGPTLKVEMREPLEGDVIMETGGFTFRVRASILRNLEGAVIEAADTFWGSRIRVKTTYGCL